MMALSMMELGFFTAEQAASWCTENGYTDLTAVDGKWFAFAPHAAMPVQIGKAMCERLISHTALTGYNLDGSPRFVDVTTFDSGIFG